MCRIGQESLLVCAGLVKRVCWSVQDGSRESDTGCHWLRESLGVGRTGQDRLWE